jgi:ABC-type lipoprotein release transport system permease subunit
MGVAIIGVIGTLFGVIVGGIVTYYINRNQFNMEKNGRKKTYLPKT